MEELIEALKFVSAKELIRANEKFPPVFSSLHEGHGVLREEIEEATEELEKVLTQIRYIWVNVREDNVHRSLDRITILKKHALNLACEAVQVTAMAEKFINSFEREKGETNG
ncbi:MAG: hypothetical protein AB6733_10895 [Clostridiaceae bacterium]